MWRASLVALLLAGGCAAHRDGTATAPPAPPSQEFLDGRAAGAADASAASTTGSCIAGGVRGFCLIPSLAGSCADGAKPWYVRDTDVAGPGRSKERRVYEPRTTSERSPEWLAGYDAGYRDAWAPRANGARKQGYLLGAAAFVVTVAGGVAILYATHAKDSDASLVPLVRF